jgi:DnaJ-class molecular chaperone
MARAAHFEKLIKRGATQIDDSTYQNDNGDTERLDGGKHACIQCMGSGTMNEIFNDPKSTIVECSMCFGSGQEYACVDCRGRGFVNMTKSEKESILSASSALSNLRASAVVRKLS